MLHHGHNFFSKKGRCPSTSPYGRFAWKWKHSEIIQPRRVRFLLLWLNNSPISIGRDSLDDSEEERLFSLQLTDNQWADFYQNSPLTDWRIHFIPPSTPPLFRTSCAKFVFSPRFDTFSSRVWHFSTEVWHFFPSSITFGRLLCYFFNKLCYFSVLLGYYFPELGYFFYEFR